MMNKLISLTVFVRLAACGGGASRPAVLPANPDPIPMTEPTPPPKPDPVAEPTPPSEPTPPVPDPAAIKAELLAAETAAYEKARPIFEKACARCHQQGGKMSTQKKRDHFDMTKYPFGGHHAMELGVRIRKSLGITGTKITMPYDKKGSVKGDDLAAIAAWADAFDASHAGGAHEGHTGHAEHKH